MNIINFKVGYPSPPCVRACLQGDFVSDEPIRGRASIFAKMLKYTVELQIFLAQYFLEFHD